MFRLPEDIEQGIHELVGAEPPAEALDAAADEQKAMEFLRLHSGEAGAGAEGPTLVGTVGVLRDLASWAQVAALYLAAFESGREVFPYFAGDQ